ncbi:hypothetical protein S40285_10787 [Stachybotrys chlorohalonatus IBT 40285]|uniref:Uncharacterized protein n=1 Tax=Stachybotrys chlorohalonatus (strain IBT 40285) TaxID=1283841 RepID=A0A084R1Z1_STAC4|nr:hypothetical protein S40285_10787 [Stachybotrys chlorohalonata IBT 40285]
MMETTSEAAAGTVPVQNRIAVSTNHYQREQTNDNIVRPALDPTNRAGAHFDALDIPFRDLVIRPLPPTPLKHFQLFLLEQTAQKWADYTNNPASFPEDRQETQFQDY